MGHVTEVRALLSHRVVISFCPLAILVCLSAILLLGPLLYGSTLPLLMLNVGLAVVLGHVLVHYLHCSAGQGIGVVLFQ